MSPKLRTLYLIGAAALVTLNACSGDMAQNAEVPSGVTSGNLYEGLDGQKINFVMGCSSGEFNQQVDDHLIKPFEEATGVDVTVVAEQGGVTKLAGEVEADNVSTSIYKFCSPADYSIAMDQDLLSELDTSLVPVDLLQEGSYDTYGFNAFSYAIGLLYNASEFSSAPTSIQDIFDTERFPGTRCMSNYPQFAGGLEAAMLENGASHDKVYPLNIESALSTMDSIKSETEFWSSAAQGFQSMLNGSCVLDLVANGSAYSIAKNNPEIDFGYTLGSAISTTAPLAIPKGAPHPQAATALLRWLITNKQSQSAFINQTSYMPAVLANVSVEIPAEAQDYALVDDNLDNLIVQDSSYYSKNIDAILEDWNEWLAK